MKHLALFTAVALSLPAMIQAQVITEGDLLVDLRAADLNASSTTWINESTSDNSVGNFTTQGGGNLNVGTIAGQLGLNVANTKNNSVVSALNAPASLLGNNTRSVEAWLYVDGAIASSKAPVGWGNNSPAGSLSEFRYSSGANGMFSGYNANDEGWVDGSLLANQWVYVAWVYDGNLMYGYVNGTLTTTVDPIDLVTTVNTLHVGAGRSGGSEPFNGYLADVRIETGVLSASDVLNNFNQGMYPVPEPATFALLGLGGLALFIRRRRA